MEMKNLQKWQNMLHKCIRCGYCYENCHLFKVTGWETDTPRGKLVMLHGILENELEATDYIVEKVFECYMCKRCDAACSAKVDVTEIFMDARKDFAEAGFDVQGTISSTDDEKCCRCQICVSACSHEARSYDAEQDRIIVDKVKCRSCGCCVAACPTGAAMSREGFGLSQKEMHDEVINFLRGSTL
jgi:ferredoxin